MNWLIGFVGSMLIAGVAYRKHSLSFSGMCAAIVLGTIMYAVGSIAWFGTLITFFVTSTLLSKWKQRAKQEVETTYEKGGRRDAGQVFANGGIGMILCVLFQMVPSPLIWFTFLGVMATVNADTWATEVGYFSRRDPISILNWRRVAKGTSGGITLLGLSATVLGAICIGFFGWLFGHSQQVYLLPCLVVAGIAGTCGSVLDSLLGASLQAMYRCPICRKDIERKTHCTTQSVHIRGWKWMNNDRVNLLSSILGGLIAMLIGYVLLEFNM